MEVTCCENEKNTATIEENIKLVSFVAKKYINSFNSYEDIISVGCIGLIKAVNTFDKTRNIKISTYAVKCIENEILMYLRRASNKHETVCGYENELENIINSYSSEVPDCIIDELLKYEEKQEIKKMVDDLPKDKREIVCLRYGLGKNTAHTQKETADILGMSQSYICVMEKKIIIELKAQIIKNF